MTDFNRNELEEVVLNYKKEGFDMVRIMSMSEDNKIIAVKEFSISDTVRYYGMLSSKNRLTAFSKRELDALRNQDRYHRLEISARKGLI